MQLLVAYKSDPAGFNMANFISQNMNQDEEMYHGNNFDLVIIPTPSISADWLEEKYNYDGFVFLSKHAAETGTLALTCHSTGNFSEAHFGGLDKQVAIPHPHLQKLYLQTLWKKKDNFAKFEITLEATHHGPTALNKPVLFIEIGTTTKEWNDKELCKNIANIIVEVMSKPIKKYDVAICFGGTHYPEKFTKILLEDRFALGTIMPKHSLEFLDQTLFSHILNRNNEAKFAFLDWRGLGKYKQKIMNFLESTDLEVIKI
jgi:D-aminoacyl-tRNA deacylase